MIITYYNRERKCNRLCLIYLSHIVQADINADHGMQTLTIFRDGCRLIPLFTNWKRRSENPSSIFDVETNVDEEEARAEVFA